MDVTEVHESVLSSFACKNRKSPVHGTKASKFRTPEEINAAVIRLLKDQIRVKVADQGLHEKSPTASAARTNNTPHHTTVVFQHSNLLDALML